MMWDSKRASQLQPGDRLLWVHTKKEQYSNLPMNDLRLVKSITIKSIHGEIIKTDFGDYHLQDGTNTEIPCGCKRFCDCYGYVNLPEGESNVR